MKTEYWDASEYNTAWPSFHSQSTVKLIPYLDMYLDVSLFHLYHQIEIFLIVYFLSLASRLAPGLAKVQIVGRAMRSACMLLGVSR